MDVEEYFVFMQNLRDLREERNLTRVQFDCIAYLGSREAYDPKSPDVPTTRDLTQRMGRTVAPATISSALADLWRRDLILKTINRRNQRERNITLTDSGKRVYEDIVGALEQTPTNQHR